MSIDTADMLAVIGASGSGIALWHEDKKREFVDTFDMRTRVARYILIGTAKYVCEGAVYHQYMSSRHTTGLSFDDRRHLEDRSADGRSCLGTYGGRSRDSLEKIAEERAAEILEQLPALRSAVLVIAPETAEQMDKITELLAEGAAIKEELDEVCSLLRMSEQDQDMTIGQWRAMIEQRDDRRVYLIRALKKCAEQGEMLEKAVAKKLYSGLPGLTDAVLDVIKELLERAVVMDTSGRRVREQVMFGDSEAATTLLKGFEQDEAKMSSDTKTKFELAMQKLRDSVKATKKGAVVKKVVIK